MRLSIQRLVLILFAFATVLAAAGPTIGGVVKTTVFQSGEEGYHTYRIPTVVKASNGDLLAIVEGRESLSDLGEIDLVMKRSTDGGQTWGVLQVVVDSADYSYVYEPGTIPPLTAGNPAPVVDMMDPLHSGRVWLTWTLDQDRPFAMYSDDHGATWSTPDDITSSIKNPSWGWFVTGPVHGIQLTRGEHAGRLIIPSDHRLSGTSSWGSNVVYSDDHGLTWQAGAADTHLSSDPVHPNEHVAVELVDGRLYFNARDQNGSSPETRAIAYSSDGGLTFDAPFAAEPQITTPVVQNSVVRFAATDEGDAQNVLLHSGPGQSNSRRDMTVRISYDEGDTWSPGTVIHTGPAAYSDLVKLDDARIGLLYEAGDTLYDQIVFGSFDFTDLTAEDWNGVVGDVNQDGAVTSADLVQFIDRWAPVSNEFYLGGVDSYQHGDLNFNGVNDLSDAFIMRQAALAAGLSTAALESLPVLEPAGLGLLATGVLFVAASYRRSMRTIGKRKAGPVEAN